MLPAGLVCDNANIWTNLALTVPVTVGQITMGVPNNASMVGQTLVFQAAALQPQICVRMTDALHVTVQMP